MVGGIYGYVHTPTNTWYIGQTQDFKQRLGGLRSRDFGYPHIEFTFIILEYCEDNKRRRMLEAHWIYYARLRWPIFNLTDEKGWFATERPKRLTKQSKNTIRSICIEVP